MSNANLNLNESGVERPKNDGHNKDTQSPPAEKTGKRSNWVIAHEVKAGVITWNVKGAGTLTLVTSALSETVRQRALEHGMVQRISDAAAIPRDTKTGKSATPQEKYLAMAELVEHYASGAVEWNRKSSGRERGPRELTGSQLLRAALLLWQPEKGEEKIKEFVKGLKQSQIAALLASAELKQMVEWAREAELEKLTTEVVDAEELLSGL